MKSECAGAAALSGSEVSLDELRRLVDFAGPESLTDSQLVALLTSRSLADAPALQTSARLLEELGGLRGISRLRPSALIRPGLGQLQAGRLHVALELGRRLVLEPTRLPLERPLDPELVARWACPRLGSLPHEEVWVLCVDGRSILRSSWLVGRGGIHGCSLLPRDVLGPVCRESASGFVLVHNHPSGDPSPSPEDIDLTRALRAASVLVGSPLLDHVIVAGLRHTSLASLGLCCSELE